MKNKKKILCMSLSVLIIGFLIGASALNTLITKAVVEEESNQHAIDSLYSSTWKWSTTKIVSTESIQDSYEPSLAADSSGNVHVVWHDWTDYAGNGTDFDIFYKRWNASSSVWTTTEVISTESSDHSFYPSLAVDSVGNVHITWADKTDYSGAGTDWDIFYKRWDSSSTTWTTTEVISTESTNGSSVPSFAVDLAGNIHITWFDLTDYAGAGTDRDVFYKRWNASSSVWTTTEVVSTVGTNHSEWPSLAVDFAGNVHIAWHDTSDGIYAGTDSEIFYKRWNASSSVWTTTEVISTESTLSYIPSLAVDFAGNVHITWFDLTDYAGAGIDYDIFYKLYSDTPVIPELTTNILPFYSFLLISGFIIALFDYAIKTSKTRRKKLI